MTDRSTDSSTPERLTAHERAELAAYEHLVEQPKLARGLALRVIRDKRLYRETHETFEQYCLERWKFSKTHINRLIDQAEVLKNLAPIGVTDLRESHARELQRLSPDDQRLVVTVVSGTAPAGSVTASHIKSVVKVIRDILQAGAIDDGSGIMVPWDELPPVRKRSLLEANLTEETYERQQRQSAHVSQAAVLASGSNEWYTPEPYVDAVRTVLGDIDIDPASCEQANRTVKAKIFHDAQSDGLTQDWRGRVFLNPPYGGMAGPFIARLVDQHERGITTAAVALVSAAATDTNWFQPLWDYPLCFARRVHFDSPAGPTTSATHGSVFAYLGPDQQRFVDVFKVFGAVVGRIDQ